MKIAQTDFTEALSIVGKVIPLKSVSGNLNCVLVRPKGKDKVEFVGSDGNTIILFDCVVKQSLDKSFIYPHRHLFNFVSNLPDGEVTVSFNKEKLLIISAGYKADLTLPDVEDYLSVPVLPKAYPFSFQKDSFSKALSNTFYAMASKIGRPQLSGLFLDFSEDFVNLVATDTFRVGFSTNIPYNGMLDGDDYKVLLDSGGILVLSDLLSRYDSKFEVAFADTRVFFKSSGLTLVCTTLDNKFPDYRKLMFEGDSVELVRRELLQALYSISTFSDSSMGNVLLTFKGNELVVSSSFEIGSGDVKLKLKKGCDKEIVYKFRIRNLIEVLEHFSVDNFAFVFKPNFGGIIAKGLDSNKNLSHLIMGVGSSK